MKEGAGEGKRAGRREHQEKQALRMLRGLLRGLGRRLEWRVGGKGLGARVQSWTSARVLRHRKERGSSKRHLGCLQVPAEKGTTTATGTG